MYRILLFVAIAAASSAAARSVWDGVYTKDQARRGQAVYQQECAKCHGQNLAGGEAAPSLTGAEFMKNWNGKSAGAFYERTRKTMPSDDPGNLSTRQYADVVAYIFGANEFPSGDQELGRDVAVLNEIRIEAKR
jgi:mono/diheme cytochrome c family protein